MIDAQPGDRPGPNQLEQEPVRFLEDLRQLHPNRGQIVDIEKAAVIDLLRRHAPEREPIRLIVEQRVERIEAARIARRAVDFRERLRDRRLHLRRFLATPFQASLDDLFFAGAFRDPLRIALGPARQIFERGHDALQFGVEILVLEWSRNFSSAISSMCR